MFVCYMFLNHPLPSSALVVVLIFYFFSYSTFYVQRPSVVHRLHKKTDLQSYQQSTTVPPSLLLLSSEHKWCPPEREAFQGVLPVLWVADLTIVVCHSGTTHRTVASLGVLLKALERPTAVGFKQSNLPICS